MRILIVDSYAAHRKVIEGFVKHMRPDAEIDNYDVEGLGRPVGAFLWSQYELLIIDSHLGSTGSGLDWLRDYGDTDNFPPTIFLSSEKSVDVAVEAMKLGARDFILKKGIDPKRLRKAIIDVLPPEPIADVMPDMKPLPDHYDTQRYAAADTQVLPSSMKPEMKPVEDESTDDYWDQQTQVLHVTPRPGD